ncbi:TetR/AcrR family transcriptional regulator [Lysobacter capsici]|uniref:TetR/AcrR family transcriptional regulator n=1 Tax=Lysobacter capsici TaxID=435897 RepID=UPI00287B88CA|nr:TetR/AcrR family transcriptional regulator [Lysobacter capsici]WND81575.1 TetR/AcrR family transcriptional regulator [Lysobacter capsici]WND86771.1 TetR/AcrR family transcriptional regulator [Lysobacter capsici]
MSQSASAQDPSKPTASATADKSAASAPPAASTKPAGPGRPKDLSKRNAILEAAKRLFLSDGYDGVSMDQIAAGAGVSKLTVYSHFGDKETLFSAAVQAYCEQHLPPPLFEPAPATALRERLIEIATAFYEMISTPEAIQIHRLLCSPQLAESPLSKMFWDAGPQRLHDEFAALLRRRVEAGELEIHDPARAATQFFALIKGEPHAMLMFGCGVTAPTELTVHIEASVAMFLRAYARREP